MSSHGACIGPADTGGCHGPPFLKRDIDVFESGGRSAAFVDEGGSFILRLRCSGIGWLANRHGDEGYCQRKTDTRQTAKDAHRRSPQICDGVFSVLRYKRRRTATITRIDERASRYLQANGARARAGAGDLIHSNDAGTPSARSIRYSFPPIPSHYRPAPTSSVAPFRHA